MSRLNELLHSLPPASLAILGLIGGAYILQILLDFDVRLYTLCPATVLLRGEVWRLVTSTLLHGSIMHIAMNFMSAVGLCGNLERAMGTVALLLTAAGSILVSPAIHVLIAFLAHLCGYQTWFQEHSLGFSGVLFHFAVIEASQSNQPRSLFGLVSVPSSVYPWALLVVLQIFMPNLSFLGHLSGILAGTLQLYGGMSCRSVMLEQRLALVRNFVPASSATESRGDTPPSLRQACSTVYTYIGHVLETIKVIIFGRGRQANSNIQLVDHDDGDDWVGLPLIAEDDDDDEGGQMV